MRLSLKFKKYNIMHVLLFVIGFFLPIELLFQYTFHLPGFVKSWYLFVVLLWAGIFLNTKKDMIRFRFNKNYILLIVLFLIFSMWVTISILMNYSNMPQYVIPRYEEMNSVFNSPVIRPLWIGVFRNIIIMLYFIGLFIVNKTHKTNNAFLAGMIVLTLLTSIYSIYQFIGFYLDLPFASLFSGHNGENITDPTGLIRRTEGLFFEPGPQSAFLCPMLVIIFSLLKSKIKKPFSDKFLLITLVMASIAALLTFSPIAYVTPFVAVGLYILFSAKKIFATLNIKILKKIALGSIIFLILFVGICQIYSKISNDDAFSMITSIGDKIINKTFISNDDSVILDADARATRAYAGMKMFMANPLWGVGLGNSVFLYYKYVPYSLGVIVMGTSAIANQYISILAETGIFGEFLFLLVLFYPLYLYRKKQKFFEENNQNLNKGYIIAYLTYILVTFGAAPYFMFSQFWVIYPFVIVSLNLSQAKER